MSESESDPDLTLERYDLEDDLNAYGSPVCILLLLLLLGFYLKTRSPIHIVCSSLEPCKTTKYM